MAVNISGNNEAGDSVRRPVFEVKFGSGGAGGLTAAVGLGADASLGIQCGAVAAHAGQGELMGITSDPSLSSANQQQMKSVQGGHGQAPYPV